MQRCVASARAVGEVRDFHVFCDAPIAGAIGHETPPFPNFHGVYSLLYLKQFVARLDYDFFIYVDSDTLFLRQPEGLLELPRHAPFHIPFETSTAQIPADAVWEGVRLGAWRDRLRYKDTPNAPYYLVDSGFWIAHHDVIDQVAELAKYYWTDADAPPGADLSLGLKNISYTLSFIAHLLGGNPKNHGVQDSLRVWMPDRLKTFTGANRTLTYQWPLTDIKVECSPAIVHLKNRWVGGRDPLEVRQ
jgi:hypothetical protein